MMYFAASAGFAVLLAILATLRTLRRRRRDLIKQERLSSAFDRSHAVRSHGHGAVGISQNLLIAQLTASSSHSRRAIIGGARRAA